MALQSLTELRPTSDARQPRTKMEPQRSHRASLHALLRSAWRPWTDSASAALCVRALATETGFPNDAQVRMQRHEMEQQRRMEQLEQARQMNQISPGDYNRQQQMETPQEWRRRAGRRRHDDSTGPITSANRTAARHATAIASGAHSGATSGGPHARTTAHTASASKVVPKENGAGTATTMHSAAPIPPSRRKELRQSVRIKATMETEARRVKNAKIADLCDEDRDKVAKLIQRIVEIGTLQEESEAEFKRQRSVLEAGITELREQVKRDADEIKGLSETLKATLLKLRDYQERVLVLEESTEAEARNRMDTDQTMDLLKLEVEKLRKLVRMQKDEMELKGQGEQRKFNQELERVDQQLKDAQDKLLQERRERILEKQKELDERLQKSMANSVATAASENAHRIISTSSQTVTRETFSSLSILAAPSIPPQQLDVSSFLNTSMELPEKIKDIMDEWKQRMEVAMAETTRHISEQKTAPVAESPTTEKASLCEKEASDSELVEETKNKKGERHGDLRELRRSDPKPAETSLRTTHHRNQFKPSRVYFKEAPNVQRMQFDKFLRIESDAELEAVDSGGDDDLVGQDDTEEEKHADESDEEQVDALPMLRRTEKRDKSSAHHRRRHRHHVAFRYHGKPSRDQKRQRGNSFQGESEILTQQVDRMPTRDDRIVDEGDSEVAFVDEINGNSPSFELINGFDNRVQRGNSFSSLYDTLLFDVVDALEGGRAAVPTSASASTIVPNQQQNGLQSSSHRTQHYHYRPDDLRGSLPASSAETSSSRFRDLLQGIQARERKLARLNGQAELHQQTASSPRHHHQDGGNPRIGLDADDDFDLFNDVKDVYEQDVLQSRQRAANRRPVTPRAYLSSAT